MSTHNQRVLLAIELAAHSAMHEMGVIGVMRGSQQERYALESLATTMVEKVCEIYGWPRESASKTWVRTENELRVNMHVRPPNTVSIRHIDMSIEVA